MKDLSNVDIQYLDLSPDICQDLERKALGKLGSLYKGSRILKDEVFNILADESIFIQYPIEDDEICGFVCCKQGHVFSFINSYIPYEKQLFAAAHELYHIWYDEDILTKGEFLRDNTIDPITGEELDEREIKANKFAAIFLVPQNVLLDELNYMSINVAKQIELGQVVKLMDKFGVPYKTMVRRLYETRHISRDQCIEWLHVPDRDKMAGILLLQKRMQSGEELNKRTRVIKINGLVDDAISVYDSGKISGDKLKYLLSLVRKKPEDFGIKLHNTRLNEEEILELLEKE